jgi:hypothetical protein
MRVEEKGRSMLTTRAGGFALTAAIVELTLTTALIHLSLGGTLFTLNGLGYIGLAVAFVVAAAVPHRLVQRFGWLPRVGLAGYALATIAGYLVMGPYFLLGWVTKAIEVALVTLVVADLIRVHGSVSGTHRAIRDAILGPRSSGVAPS